jgi:hypothetical protein
MSVQGHVVGGAWIGADGSLTPVIADKGDTGAPGAAGSPGAASTVPGPEGNDGWSPIFAGELDGTRTVIKVADWTGGEGTKPAVGQYIGTAGYVATKTAAFNFNAAKRVRAYSATTNASGVAAINYSDLSLSAVPQVVALPATTVALSGPTRSCVSAVTAIGCTVTVQQQAILTGIISLLTGAIANVLVIES